MSAADPHFERLLQLEQIVTHLQHDLDMLNSVLRDQQKQLDLLKTVLGRLDERVGRLTASEEKFDPAAERPPHY